MCGICGFVGPRDDDTLLAMRDALRHRGPDEAGCYQDEQVSLGHRRLSIVDLAHGQQPAFNHDRSVVVVFNGEIYNHPTLRPELERRGCRFASNSDTLSIVHAYEVFGFDCLTHLHGMFAFVLYDRRRRLLFGARDRLGKKPLYYTVRPFSRGENRVDFAFASEVKSLRKHPVVDANLRLSRDGLISYLLHDYVLGTESIYEGIARLDPGSAFCFGLPGSDTPGFRTWRYWNLAIGSAGRAPNNGRAPSLDEAASRVLELLSESVRKRLMSDVPLGTFLSGGVDSSTLVALLRRHLPPEQIKTFSIGFDQPSFDESAYAEQVARHFGTVHACRQFTARDLLDRIPSIAESLDEPFADPSIVPVSMLCEFAREHVTVALGGDGGDELFAGYDPFRAVYPADLYARWVPDWLHQRVIVPAARWIPASDQNLSPGFKVTRFLRGAKEKPAYRPAVWMGAFAPAHLRRLIPDLASEMVPETAYAKITETQQAYEGDSLAAALDFFERYYLPDDILCKVDRASMMHSLEVRCPFLDTELVEYVNALPHEMKLRHGVSKVVLKHALTRGRDGPLVPREIVHRKKKGFGIPVARWIRHELRELFHERLVDAWPRRLAFFDRAEIARLLGRHQLGAENNYKELWALFMLAEWSEAHGCEV